MLHVWCNFACVFLFFFFQAEDGIRDGRVTGVQTCALPIYAFSATDSTAAAATSGADSVDGSRETRLRSAARAPGRSPPEKIGRASCRERGEISVVAVSLKKKKR